MDIYAHVLILLPTFTINVYTYVHTYKYAKKSFLLYGSNIYTPGYICTL